MSYKRFPYEFIPKSSCPYCKCSLVYYPDEILKSYAVCPKCSEEFSLRDSLNKEVFHSIVLEEGGCPNCETRLIFSDEEKKQGPFRCVVCKEEYYIWEVRNPKRQSGLNVVEVKLREAMLNNEFDKESALINLLLPEIKQKLGKVVKTAKNSKKIGRAIGWTAAILTGGIGLEDLLIVPAVSYAAQRTIGTSLEKSLELFSELVYRKVFLLSRDEINLTKLEFASLIEEAYLLLILREIRDIEAFLYQIESYANREPDKGENIRFINKLVGLFERSSNKNTESMAFFWFSIGKIIDSVYPSTNFYSRVEEYYLGKQTQKQKTEEKETISKYEKVLGVKWNGSNFDEIKIAYRKLVNIHHPDKNGGDHRKFLEIQEAYIYFKQLYG